MDTKVNWDIMGMLTSALCAIHCALLPVVVSSLPVFGVNIIHNAYFEWSMIGLAFAIGSYSLLHGFNRHHRSSLPLLIFFFGFLLLLLKQFFHPYENWFLILAVPLIICAHFINYRLCQKTKCAGVNHKH